MLGSKGFSGILPRKHFRLSAAAAPALLLLASGVWPQPAAAKDGAVIQLAVVPVPVAPTNTTGGMYSFDISFVDPTTQTYYLADRSNAAVDVANARTGTFVKQITATPPFAGFTGNSETSGPNGVVTAGGCIVATDASSRVVSFTVGGTQVSNVSTGGTGSFRADELAYDPKDGLLLVINPAEPSAPFGTLIGISSSCKLSVGRKITFASATNGAEQPVWDPTTLRFYLALPSISGTTAAPGPIGAIARINPYTANVETMFAVPFCMPAGLALGPNGTFLAGCSVVYDTMGDPWFGADTNSANPVQAIIDTNGVYAFVQGIGSSDEVWYNSSNNHWYTGSQNTVYSPHPVASTSGALSTTDQGAGLLGVIDGTSQTLDQIVPTINVPAVTGKHPSGSAHSVAANAANNWVFVPLPANNAILGCLTGCIGVYARHDKDVATD